MIQTAPLPKFEDVMRSIGKLGGTMKFFPSDPDSRIGIGEEIIAMCSSIEQVDWLVKRLPKLFSDWPGMKEVRSVLCSRFKPADGIECYSEIYLEGIPSEREALPALGPGDPRSRELPPGEAGEFIRELVVRKSL
jgi:hypothetical protein